MGRRPRLYRPDLVVEVTSNTAANHFFLRPCKESVELYLGVVGRALELNPAVRLHALNPLSTHSTALLSSSVPSQISSYLCFVKTNLAKELRRLHGIDQSMAFWENRRARAIPIANDPASLERSLRYCLSQGTKEDLVKTPYEWPGVTGVRALTKGTALKGWWYDRTKENEARVRGERVSKRAFATPYSVELSPLPHWVGMEESAWRQRVNEIVDDIAAEAMARRGSKVLGADAVLAFSPMHRGRGPQRAAPPICHAAGSRAFETLRDFIVGFCNAFAAASDSERNGDGTIPYPAFSFPATRRMTAGDAAGLEPIGLFGAIGVT